ncbi:hypothetical protein NSQ26_00415 [Bacillus sp. FSL W7-1360]
MDEMLIHCDLPDERDMQALAYRNEQRSWDVYFDDFDEFADKYQIQALLSADYKKDPERGIFLFTVETSEEAEERLATWVEDVWIPLSWRIGRWR